MKTSLLISGIAAFCLLVTFAEAPRWHGEEKIKSASNENFSRFSMIRATMLPGVIITADRKNKAVTTFPVAPSNDLRNLKFDATEFLEAAATKLDEAEVSPEAAETDFSYLKFKISDFISGSELTGEEVIELPESEIAPSVFSIIEPLSNEFEYLRFDVNKYISNTWMDSEEIGELPLPENTNGNKSGIYPLESTSKLSYLKFDVTKFYNASNLSAGE